MILGFYENKEHSAFKDFVVFLKRMLMSSKNNI